MHRATVIVIEVIIYMLMYFGILLFHSHYMNNRISTIIVEKLRVDTIYVPTDTDVILTTRLLQSEGRFQPVEGQQHIIGVVLNRMEKSGDCLKDIIYSPKQFSGVTTANFKSSIDTSLFDVVVKTLTYGDTLPNFIHNFNNFDLLSQSKKNYVNRTLSKYKKVGDHTFYKEALK